VTDSPLQNSQPILVGRVVAVHGLAGGVRATVLSDVSHRFGTGQTLYILGQPYVVSSSSPASLKSNQRGASKSAGSQIILWFEGFDTEASVKSLVGAELTVPETEVPNLPEGEYFHYQIVGLNVVTEEGEDLGSISEILETGSNDVYVTSTGSGELLIPALSHVIREIRLRDGVMVVSLPDGLR
jgi:16S rRNA processing protein RimM